MWRLNFRGEFMEILQPIIEKDPAVNPPCIVSSGCVTAVDITPEPSTPTVSQALSHPVSQALSQPVSQTLSHPALQPVFLRTVRGRGKVI